MTEPLRPRFYLGEWIKHANLTLEEVADRAGLSKTHVAQLKQGKRRWNEGVVVALAGALGLRSALDLFRDPSEIDELDQLFNRIPAPMQLTAKRLLRGLAEPERLDVKTNINAPDPPVGQRKRRC